MRTGAQSCLRKMHFSGKHVAEYPDMKTTMHWLVNVALGLTLWSGAQAQDVTPGNLTLWYRKPAAKWVEALPIGNGRLGAMIFGGVTNEHLQFNEDTLWTGQPHEYQHEGAVKFLPQMRELLNEGRVLERAGLELEKEARKLEASGQSAQAREKMKAAREKLKAARAKQKQAEDIGMKEFMSEPLRQMVYQAFGDVRLSFPEQANATDYRRELDLDSAVAKVSYRTGDATFVRECFASHPDQVIVWRVTADKPGRVSFTAKLDSPHQSATTALRDGDQLALFGQVQEGGLKFEARMKIVAQGGKVTTTGNGITVENADSAMLELAAATSFKNFQDISADPAARCKETLKAVAEKDFATLLQTHLADYRRLFRRVQLDLGQTDAAQLPTDQRIEHFATGNDPGLAVLAFQYGRYLLIASSRAGGQPANLQGSVERVAQAAVGQQIDRQHQHRDELLARRGPQLAANAPSRCST